MRIVKIKGGIGNQLFQYAFAKYIEQKLNETIKLDFFSCYGCADVTCEDRLKLFSISLEEASKKEVNQFSLIKPKFPLLTLRYRAAVFLEKTFNKSYYFESSRDYLDFDAINRYSIYDGYWQSWRYPEAVKDSLFHDLAYKNNLDPKTQAILAKICRENAVFVGIRKGDYVATKGAKNRYGSFSQEYYLNAMRYIAERVENPVFYVFTNDVRWCKNNLDFGAYNVIYREKEEQANDIEELIVMSNCKHAIIINSTYHWWGAFLIKNDGKIVIAPNSWFADGTKVDIIPPEWIRMERNGVLTK